MSNYITEIMINSFRGITNLEIKGLGEINILLGDNNCGKTSFLEAIEVLSSPLDFNNIVMISRQRDRFRNMPIRFTQSQYNSFLNLFNKNKNISKMDLSCVLGKEKIYVTLEGSIKKSLLSFEDIQNIKKYGKDNFALDEEVDTFEGTLLASGPLQISLFEEKPTHFNVSINKFSRIIRSNNINANYPIEFLSTIDHIVLDKFRRITNNKELTKSVVELLQASFDSEILDIRNLEEEDGRSYQAIDHKTLGYMPLSTYGDGMKKAIAIAGAAASINDGILLIDEFETAIHTKAMESVFKFMVNICKERRLQLFATTHSIEAVTKMLSSNKQELDNIRVITLYKKENKTVARVLDGNKALEVKDELGLELR